MGGDNDNGNGSGNTDIEALMSSLPPGMQAFGPGTGNEMPSSEELAHMQSEPPIEEQQKFAEQECDHVHAQRAEAHMAIRGHLKRVADRDPAPLLELANDAKSHAAEQFAEKRWKFAVKGYLLANWLLKDGEQPYSVINDKHTEHTIATPGKLGPGDGERFHGPAREPTVAAERVKLHLNLAACALQLGDWNGALAAADWALSVEPSQPKALYRRAQALEGAGELGQAQACAVALLKLEGQATNRDARKLFERVKAARVERKKSYGAAFQKRIPEAPKSGTGDAGGSRLGAASIGVCAACCVVLALLLRYDGF